MSYQDDAKTTKVVADCTGDWSWDETSGSGHIVLVDI